MFLRVTLTDYLGEKKLLVIPTGEVAIMAIDLWDSHPNQEFNKLMQSNLRTNVLPLLSGLGSSLKVFVFGHGNEVTPGLEKKWIITWATWTLWRRMWFWLKTRKTRYFLFIGYASNMCLLNRPIVSMPVLNQRAKRLGGGAILVRDCSLVFIPEYATHTGASRGEWTRATETLIQSCFSLGSTDSASIVVVPSPASPQA